MLTLGQSQETWDELVALSVQEAPKSTLYMSPPVFCSPFPTTKGSISLEKNPSFVSKKTHNTFLHSFVHSTNTF